MPPKEIKINRVNPVEQFWLRRDQVLHLLSRIEPSDEIGFNNLRIFEKETRRVLVNSKGMKFYHANDVSTYLRKRWTMR